MHIASLATHTTLNTYNLWKLTRHLNAKHVQYSCENQPVAKEAEDLLHPLIYKTMLEKGVAKLAKDECYPEDVRMEFEAYSVGKLDEVLTVYSNVRDVIKSFCGDSETFYPQFYKCIAEAEIPFPGISKNAGLLLGFEVANHVVAHLSGSTFKDDILTFSHYCTKFTEKEKSIICYVSGYVFSTIYRRIRFSKKIKTTFHQQCLSILLAGKHNEDSPDLSAHDLVNIHSRGRGLWKVAREVLNIFTAAEARFLDFADNVKKHH